MLTSLAGRRVRTASISTLGCKLNQAESYRLQVDLARAGVDLLPFGEPVDLSIVNTCTVTHTADQQARQLLRRARSITIRLIGYQPTLDRLFSAWRSIERLDFP